MKLLRASCPCGYITRKARSGYGYEEWWFPLFNRQTGVLTDIHSTLSGEAKARISKVLSNLGPKEHTGQEAAASKINQCTQEIMDDYFTGKIRELQEDYAQKAAEYIFNPEAGVLLPCPHCHQSSLLLEQVLVMARCESGCAHVYPWLDSNTSGCPLCGHFPRDYQTETEPQFAGLPRVICFCCSTTDCISHIDGYCPACGNLPEAYGLQGMEYCGKHHELLVRYEMPISILFMLPDGLSVQCRFPQAKFYPEKNPEEEGFPGVYCVSCEADHQAWQRESFERE